MRCHVKQHGRQRRPGIYYLSARIYPGNPALSCPGPTLSLIRLTLPRICIECVHAPYLTNLPRT